MTQIIDLRIADPKKQKELCEELAAWAKAESNVYAEAFANIYLAFYFTGQNDVKAAGPCLNHAKALLVKCTQPCDELLLRLYKQLGTYYVMQSNEQGAIQSYLESIAIAQKLNDYESECVACNNLGFAFERHSSFQEARSYFERAFSLIENAPCCDLHVYVLANLMISSLQQNHYDDAKKYLQKSIALPYDTPLRDIYAKRNECCFYAATGAAKKALECAGFIKTHEELCADGHIAEFENYMLLFDGMMNIDSKDYAEYFLNMMALTHGEILHQCQMLEDRRVKFKLKYGSEEEQQAAFREYFNSTTRLQKQSDIMVLKAVKSKMKLDKVLKRNEALHSMKSKLERQIEKDALTGLYNRRYLDKLVERRSQIPDNSMFGIIMVDIDYFKEYNDFYGHLKGDKVLKALAACLKESCTDNIKACRFGGDEFICVCDGAAAVEIEHFAQRVRESLAALDIPHEKSRCGNRVTISVGCAYEPASFSASPYMMLELADRALYDAKLAGRNTFVRKQADSNE